ncbi:hypothetical protein FACS1894196_0530 [Clostridia bacterium]|nr:hypothetical protein FACS1894196_0530 [Clostridia bacterium]
MKKMKKAGLWMLVGMLCFALFSSAHAQEGREGSDPYKLPEDIAVVFEDAQWSGYRPVFPARYIVDSGYENGAFFPVIMKRGDANVLCVLKRQNGAWGIDFINENALFSGDALPEGILYYISPYRTQEPDAHGDVTISYTFDPPANDRKEVSYHFAMQDGVWNLRIVQIFHPPVKGRYVGGMDYRETDIVPLDGDLTYHTILNEEDNDSPVWRVPSGASYTLAEFDVNALPLSYEDAFK